MTYPITNYTRVWVRGRLIDVLKAAREEAAYGVTGPVQFIPQIKDGLNADLMQMLYFRPFVATPNATTGYFAINLPATNDPDINPVDFSYEVILPTGGRYLIKVPYDTPTLWAPGDPLHEEQVLELVNVVPDPENPSGTVQLLVGQPGRSIESVTIDGDHHLVGEYDDGMPFDAGLLPGVWTVNGRTTDVVLDQTDVGLSEVANLAPDDLPVSEATQTALDALQDDLEAHEDAVDPHPQYLTPAEGNAAYDVSGAASAAVAAHVGDSDPHTQYLTATEGNAAYMPLAGTAKNSLVAIRFVGFKGTNGAPTTGTWAVGDVVMDNAKVLWRCTVAGTPGTWV